MDLSVLPGRFSICRLESHATLPAWVLGGTFWSMTRTADELSIVCASDVVPSDVRAESGWAALRVCGPLDFAQTGIVAELSRCLAAATVSVFVVSTYDTDYLLIPERDLDRAVAALRDDGHGL